jgi:hypothetical protein
MLPNAICRDRTCRGCFEVPPIAAIAIRTSDRQINNSISTLRREIMIDHQAFVAACFSYELESSKRLALQMVFHGYEVEYRPHNRDRFQVMKRLQELGMDHPQVECYFMLDQARLHTIYAADYNIGVDSLSLLGLV